jgi:hypothetical protein
MDGQVFSSYEPVNGGTPASPANSRDEASIIVPAVKCLLEIFFIWRISN